MLQKEINISDYNYFLSEEKIAKYPLNERDKSKLLVYEKSNIYKKVFNEIPDFFGKDDLLVFNETKVIQARMEFEKETGAAIEIFCLEPDFPSDYERIFQSKNECSWKCSVGNLKKWKSGKLYKILNSEKGDFILSAEKISHDSISQRIQFQWDNDFYSFGDILEIIGQTPIPPYLKRKSELSDKERYQTIYSKNKGSVAAPTAGLHFTEKVISEIQKKGTKTDYLTLHVGAGTFRPVKSENIESHEMHTEHFIVSKYNLKNFIEKSGKITATGTTTVRSIESLYWLGVKLITENDTSFELKQWDAYNLSQEISVENSLKALLNYLKINNLENLQASTQIIIAPGYKFKIVNRLITNFHQPQSTLLLLVSAFIGDDWKKVYNYAVENNFRFLSYGDSSILIP
jgi:S-adenosylmethionine:tRNA ribosyltransferase-isomerase